MLDKLKNCIKDVLKDVYTKIDVDGELKDGTFNVNINVVTTNQEDSNLITPAVFEERE